MALDKLDSVDTVGIEKDTGFAVLTIADSWDWADEPKHLLALQAKLNAYFGFIESGQILEDYPDAAGRPLVIDVEGRFPLPKVGVDFLKRASESGANMGVTVRSRHYPGSQ